MQPNGIITLLTDFGEQDGFVGTMKGVILSINPHARIVDISHQIAPQNIDAGAFVLRNSYGYFPEGTIHVVVIDPGVGSARRAIGTATMGYYFLAPDNGVLKYIFHETPPVEVVQLSNPKYFLHPISGTFHGRDIFAPAAAHLSLGIELKSLGAVISDYHKGRVREAIVGDDSIEGQVIYIDRFGNLITNISEELLRSNLAERPFYIQLRTKRIEKVSHSYVEGNSGEPIAIIGSSGWLEISVNQGNAQKLLAMGEGDSIRICYEH